MTTGWSWFWRWLIIGNMQVTANPHGGRSVVFLRDHLPNYHGCLPVVKHNRHNNRNHLHTVDLFNCYLRLIVGMRDHPWQFWLDWMFDLGNDPRPNRGWPLAKIATFRDSFWSTSNERWSLDGAAISKIVGWPWTVYHHWDSPINTEKSQQLLRCSHM